MKNYAAPEFEIEYIIGDVVTCSPEQGGNETTITPMPNGKKFFSDFEW